MSIQKSLNEQAINMLPRCAFFLKEFGGNTHNLIRNICNSSKCLDDMTIVERNEFDKNQLSQLLQEKMSSEESHTFNKFLEEVSHA